MPVLYDLGYYPKKTLSTTSFTVIFSSFTCFLGHIRLPVTNYKLLYFADVDPALGVLLGIWLITEKLKRIQVKSIIGIVLIAIAIKMTYYLVF